MGANEEATVRDLKVHQAVILVWSKNWNAEEPVVGTTSQAYRSA
jgi:hypothetical protein